MKCFAILALVAAATAYTPVPNPTITVRTRTLARTRVPTPTINPNPQCLPPAYACKNDLSGWVVCNVDGTWLNGGSCGVGTTCTPINNLPYCV